MGIDPRTETSTVFSWPTRLISEVQEFLAMTAAIKTNPWLFVAFEAVICAPSGDQLHMVSSLIQEERVTYLRRRKNVPGEASKGFSTSASRHQSEVLHILTDLSSDAVARNSPTGSQHTPFTNPRCKSSTWRRSINVRSSARAYSRGNSCIPRVNPHQMRTLESRPTEARYLSPGAQPRSVTSEFIVRNVIGS